MYRQFAVVPSLVLAVALLVVPAARSSVHSAPLTAPPTTMTYQGILRANGAPANGTFSLQFKLYNVASGGAAVYTETDSVTAANGLFTVILGQITPLPPSVFQAGGPLFLGITVGSDAELTPRTPLTTEPFAFLAGTAVNNWALNGNAGTSPSTQFLGTTDGQALEFRVNNARALLLIPNATSPSLVGGFSGNTATSTAGTIGTAVGATIAGGGSSALTNRVTDDFGTVSGGRNNRAGDNAGTTSDQRFATVGGGDTNTASTFADTVAGGNGNTASGGQATVGGGFSNTASGGQAMVGGGGGNTASGAQATVGGGAGNTASGDEATVSGGDGNTASNLSATVGGGNDNTATGFAATVGGGYFNIASGATSLAAGQQAQALGDGTFVWNDDNITGSPFASNTKLVSTGGTFNVNANNSFHVRATGGARFVTSATNDTGVFLAPGAGTWTGVSHSSLKEHFVPVDARGVLERLAAIPVETWNLRSEDPSVRHMGPMAQEFWAAFGLGYGEAWINQGDADGVAFAAIQGLYQLWQEQDAATAVQQEQLAAAQAEIDALRARVTVEREHVATVLAMQAAQQLALEARLAALERTRQD